MSTPYAYSTAFASNRAKSQDASGVYERGDVLVVVLADGGGGMRGGEAASRSLVAVVESAVNDSTFQLERVQPWIDLFRATDVGLVANGAGETTGVVIVVGPWGILGMSIGDSEAWVVTPQGVDNLTVGQYTRQRLGTRRAAVVIFERSALSGVLVVATDGLFKYAATDVIAGIVRDGSLAEVPERLVELVRLRSGKVADDVAVVLVQRKLPQTVC